MVLQPAPSVSLPLPATAVIQKYPGEGELLPQGDPPYSVTGRLPRPLGKKGPVRAEWYHLCDLKEQRFQDLLKLAKETPPDERTRDMCYDKRSLPHSCYITQKEKKENTDN
jgi:hypothetical protein